MPGPLGNVYSCEVSTWKVFLFGGWFFFQKSAFLAAAVGVRFGISGSIFCLYSYLLTLGVCDLSVIFSYGQGLKRAAVRESGVEIEHLLCSSRGLFCCTYWDPNKSAKSLKTSVTTVAVPLLLCIWKG